MRILVGVKLMNQFIAKCSQCDEIHRKKDMKHYLAEELTYADGRVEREPEMWFCLYHVADWDLAYEGMTREEMPEGPIQRKFI